MIIEYLEKIYQEMYEERLNLERDYQKKSTLLNDNIKFIQTLEESLDENYESFSPRKVDQESHRKISSLLEEQKRLETEVDHIRSEILKSNIRLEELDSVLKSARDKEKESLEKEAVQKKELYGKKILEIQEFERQRIARDLHDSVVQNLTNMVHKVEICSKLMDVDPIRCRLELQAMSKNIREIIQNMREVIYDLRPMSLDDIGLDITIERELSKIRNNGFLNVSYEIEGESVELPPIISLTILRVVQEACNNILKHAQANHVCVCVKYGEKYVEVRVRDDGIGFDVNGITHLDRKDGSGFGISMMKERISLLDGEVEVNSKSGKGTEIVVKVPIGKEDMQ